MAEAPPNPDPIPADLARGFAIAVLAFEQWRPEQEGHKIFVRGNYVRPIELCRLLEQFTDALPENVFTRLRSYMHDEPHGRLIAALEAQPTYAVAAFCLRKMMEGRIELAGKPPGTRRRDD